ncbi:MAG: hypothetical protein AB7F79_11785 [Steroidobacteraceae bacterium]
MIKVHKASDSKFKQVINSTGAEFFADVTIDIGGDGSAPSWSDKV